MTARKHLLIAILPLLCAMLATGQTFTPVADTDGQSDAPAGTNPILNASKWCHLFIRFDLTSFTGIAKSATLRIHQVNSSVPYTLNVNTTSTDSWVEGGTKPTTADLITSVNPATTAGYKEIDITGYVQKKMMANKVVSVSITTDQNGWISFDARENATNTPELVIVAANGNMYTLRVTSVNGSVTRDPDRVYYEADSTVTLNATPDPGSQFTGWSGDTVATAGPLTLKMYKDLQVTAEFKQAVVEPDTVLIDPNATAATVELFRFLRSNYGKKMLTGCWTESQGGGNAKVVSCSGKYPAIWGQDMSSWYADRNDPLWAQTWQNTLKGFQTAWDRGQILQLNWHWMMVSSKVNGVYKRDAWGKELYSTNNTVQMMTDQQWADIVTPGTALNDALIEDIDYHVVNFLKKIVDRNGNPIPILFRPLHELDGGWFWWTCTAKPERTAQLYKILQDRIMNHHQMHNLIWIWNNGVGVSNGSWPPYQTVDNPKRAAYYPGDAYCDIVGIDLYGFDPVNRGTYMTTGKTYRDAWNMLKAAITQKKMLALCEAEGLPDPQKCFNDPSYAPWLYCLPWYSDTYYDDVSKTVSLCAWNNTQFNSPYVINNGAFLNTVVTAISDPAWNGKSVNIYPNPSRSGNAKLETKGFPPFTKFTVTISDLTGKRLTSFVSGNPTNILDLPVASLPKGMVIVDMRAGTFRKTLKLVVE